MKTYNCLQTMPNQCRYCSRYHPEHKNPCNAANGRESWEMVRSSYNYCNSFIPREEHCAVCSLKFECITGA